MASPNRFCGRLERAYPCSPFPVRSYRGILPGPTNIFGGMRIEATSVWHLTCRHRQRRSPCARPVPHNGDTRLPLSMDPSRTPCSVAKAVGSQWARGAGKISNLPHSHVHLTVATVSGPGGTLYKLVIAFRTYGNPPPFPLPLSEPVDAHTALLGRLADADKLLVH